MLDGEDPLKATPFYYQLDHLGTPQELTDFSGEIMWSAKYRAYGNLAALDVSEIDNPLRFQGQYFDAETGLHYNRNRYYNPGTKRFLTPDPINLAGGLNNYYYVPNPTGWVDPLGLSSGCPGKKDTSSQNKQNESPPPELSRSGAFRQAKTEAGIPRSQNPDPVFDPTTGKTQQYKYARMTDKAGESILNSDGKPILAREYQFTRADGSKVIIQDHSAGHQYHEPGNKGDQTAHFNLRLIENPRTGKVPGAKDHYYFKDKK